MSERTLEAIVREYIDVGDEVRSEKYAWARDQYIDHGRSEDNVWWQMCRRMDALRDEMRALVHGDGA